MTFYRGRNFINLRRHIEVIIFSFQIKGGIVAIDIFSDSNHFISAAQDRDLKIYSISTKQLIHHISDLPIPKHKGFLPQSIQAISIS